MKSNKFVQIGKNVVILTDSKDIGNPGFGYEPDVSEFGYKIPLQLRPHSFKVIIEDNVRIGRSVTIDRGRHRDTVIGEGTKIDNHVHIGHNAIIGKNCLLCAHSNIGGSCEIGDRVKVWMSATIIDHIKIGEGATIGAGSVVVHDVPSNTTVKGVPAK